MGDTMKCERYRRAAVPRKAVEAYLAAGDFRAAPEVAA